MYRVVAIGLCLTFPLTVLSGCGGSSAAKSSTPASTPTAAPDTSYLLTEEPAGARGVAEVRRDGRDGQEVLVAGWVAGSLEPIISGRAAFTIVDLQLPAPECTAKPYSYCCMAKEALLPNLVMVKFVDDEGRTILRDARDLLGIQEGSIVVVRGHVQCGEDGAATSIVADALYDRGYSENPLQLAVFNTGLPVTK